MFVSYWLANNHHITSFWFGIEVELVRTPNFKAKITSFCWRCHLHWFIHIFATVGRGLYISTKMCPKQKGSNLLACVVAVLNPYMYIFFQSYRYHHIDGLMQERCNSTANPMELHLSCTNPLIYTQVRCDMWDSSLTFDLCILGNTSNGNKE